MSTVPSESAPILPPVLPPYLQPGVDLDIDYDAFVTEDHKPVENIFIEKQYRLLTHPLYASWPGPGEGRPFVVYANVGWFYQLKTPAVVPDCLLSLDVTYPENVHVKRGHSYYQWDMGKPPDVVIEAVSDRRGDEEALKKDLYARLGVLYYAIFDPDHFLSTDTLQTHELVVGEYRRTNLGPWAKVGLGMRLWQGTFEGLEAEWLRWCDAHGEIIPTAEERAAQADQRATQAEERIRLLEAELRQLKGEPPA
jgi:Uma2 family endonuclease